MAAEAPHVTLEGVDTLIGHQNGKTKCKAIATSSRDVKVLQNRFNILAMKRASPRADCRQDPPRLSSQPMWFSQMRSRSCTRASPPLAPEMVSTPATCSPDTVAVLELQRKRLGPM